MDALSVGAVRAAEQVAQAHGITVSNAEVVADGSNLLVHLKPRKVSRGLPEVWLASTGEQLAKVTENKTKVEITIDRKEAPDFAAFFLEEVQKLFEERRSNGWRPRSTKNGE